MDALKGIPDNVNVLKTERGDARLQKTDIFKKLMWFSYPMDDTWVPLQINRVKEIQQLNKDGVIPPDLGEVKEPENKATKAPDYENVVGQDSLTRLDERNRNKKKNKNRNKNKDKRPGAQTIVIQEKIEITQMDVAKNPNPNQPQGNRNNKRRFRPNRNKNRNDQNNKGNEGGA
jgi:hypothetical protein